MSARPGWSRRDYAETAVFVVGCAAATVVGAGLAGAVLDLGARLWATQIPLVQLAVAVAAVSALLAVAGAAHGLFLFFRPRSTRVEPTRFDNRSA